MKAEHRILEADDRRLSATSAHDTTALRELFTDDFSYTHSNGLREGASGYIERIETGAVRYLDMRRVEARVSLFGEMAIVEGSAVMTYAPRGGAPTTLATLYLAVWRCREGTWLMSHYASTQRPA